MSKRYLFLQIIPDKVGTAFDTHHCCFNASSDRYKVKFYKNMQTSLKSNLSSINWTTVTDNMNNTGYSLVKQVLSAADCTALTTQYNKQELFRKTISMERYRFGLGEYKYYDYPLPGLLQTIRETVYPPLAAIANSWMKVLNTGTSFPGTFNGLQQLCHTNGQTRPTVLQLQYGKGGYNTLHQDLYGDIFFPMQVVLFLSEPGTDYEGGQFVLVEQRPRAQSKAIVLQPHKADMLIFTTNYRPVKGSKGYYRVNMKHGVSELQSGNRNTIGIIFHDAL
jgi:hypothetical protein